MGFFNSAFKGLNLLVRKEPARLLKVNTWYVSATMVLITYSSEKCLTFGVDFAKQKSAVKP